MSVSAPAHQRLSVRGRPFPYVLLAVLGALPLVGLLVAIAVSINSSASVGATAEFSGAVRPLVARGDVRNPGTHVIMSLPRSTLLAGSTPGPGHK
jgi:hypothetical protein